MIKSGRILTYNVECCFERGVIVKKFLFITAFVIIMIFSFMNVSAEQIYYNDEYHTYDAGVIGLKVDGETLENLPMYPVIINNYTMVPVREVFEALGSKVIWHDDTCQVEVADNGVSVFVKIGDRNTTINGQVVPIAAEQPLPMLIGKTPAELKSMVPVRFVAEKLGYKVDWDDVTRTVLISRPNTGEDDEIIGDIVYDDEVEIPEKDGVFGKIHAKTDADYDYIYIPAKTGMSPKITRYANPDRVVLDFKGASFDSVGGSVTVNGNCVDTVRYSNHETVARVVLDISDNTQVMVMSDAEGILVRAECSANEQIMYDAFSGRVYFDKTYAGNGKSVNNGYSVTFSNLKLENQTIKIHDSNIYEIIIANSASGCSVTVDGSKKLAYTAEKGFFKSDSPVVEDKPIFRPEGDRVIVIDAGHGGSDPGALGKNSNGKIVAEESKINLKIALLVGKKLEASGIEVVYTRDDDSYVKLQERSELANEIECDLFVSIHCNSIENSSINGTQVYYHPASETGTELAENIYDELVDRTGLSPKNLQNGSHLYVIRTTVSPAVLVETAFISNANDRNYLLSSDGQETIAESIYQGIMKTLD
ncbi:MAG: AMIN domain-containing protein [Ruminococcaceae bacterium]|nr:AMIN domain-containing protein [Oscillospiraceae bacterium]